MQPGTLLGILAFGTIGVVLVGAIWHFSSMLRDPNHRFHAANVFLENGKGAATSTAEHAEPNSQLAKPLMTRLNESIDSQHEADPSEPSTQPQRETAFRQEKLAASTNR